MEIKHEEKSESGNAQLELFWTRFYKTDMRKIVTVLIETTLDYQNLQFVLDESVTKRTPFVSGITVHKPLFSSEMDLSPLDSVRGVEPMPIPDNGDKQNEEQLEKDSRVNTEPYVPPYEPNACDLGGGWD